MCNSNYAPNGVADYTVMLMLLSLRKYKPALWRAQVNDYSLAGLQGRELRNLTVGILGTGKIGAAVIKNLSGFGCRILASVLVDLLGIPDLIAGQRERNGIVSAGEQLACRHRRVERRVAGICIPERQAECVVRNLGA